MENITEIGEDFFFIERGYLCANHFVYRGDPVTLIDTGYKSSLEETLQVLEYLGVSSRAVRRIVCTHTHCDHIGGNREIQATSGCRIFLHEVGKHYVDTGNDWATWWRYYCQEADLFDCTDAVAAADRLAIGPFRFTVLFTPGHAADGIVLYEPGEEILISADTLWEHDMGVINERVEGCAAAWRMKQSLNALADLPVRRVYPGHGRSFTDFAGALSRSRKRLDTYLHNPRRIGTDVLKKITVYTLLMLREIPEARFFDHLMQTAWFPDTVNFYFSGRYREKYDETMTELMQKGAIVQTADGRLQTTVKP